MFVFQLQAHKKKENEEQTAMQRQFLQSSFLEQAPIFSDSKDFEGSLSVIEKSFRKHGIADFITTLTPGAQNAIYAASFAWGYENAARYVRGAMKLSEVQNAQSIEEKSKAVLENIQKQASQEKEVDISPIIWSFYNEDMKETQVETSRSQSFTEKEKMKQQITMPQDSHQAIASGIMQNSLTPLILYCAAQEATAEANKREELARLLFTQAQQLEIKGQKESDPEQIVLKHKEEILQQLKVTENQIQQTIKMIEKTKEEDQERLKQILQKHLPLLLSLELIHGQKKLRKAALKRQLQKWLAFCSSASSRLSSLPLGKLIKLVSLAKLFR
ncbi:MAG: hypothetical protein QXT25_02745 [Candidatus Anstonellaceae archaeon]